VNRWIIIRDNSSKSEWYWKVRESKSWLCSSTLDCQFRSCNLLGLPVFFRSASIDFSVFACAVYSVPRTTSSFSGNQQISSTSLKFLGNVSIFLFTGSRLLSLPSWFSYWGQPFSLRRILTLTSLSGRFFIFQLFLMLSSFLLSDFACNQEN
jgi:hypothetical protein